MIIQFSSKSLTTVGALSRRAALGQDSARSLARGRVIGPRRPRGRKSFGRAGAIRRGGFPTLKAEINGHRQFVVTGVIAGEMRTTGKRETTGMDCASVCHIKHRSAEHRPDYN